MSVFNHWSYSSSSSMNQTLLLPFSSCDFFHALQYKIRGEGGETEKDEILHYYATGTSWSLLLLYYILVLTYTTNYNLCCSLVNQLYVKPLREIVEVKGNMNFIKYQLMKFNSGYLLW